ncbi:YdeI/OmpD-associated family protein [Streptomyces sp. NPDC021224]|uniref:YdeI/OmpD-associated family protein n=1 Tax=unclassified Streptomyces TaxID=2593676 RepID=UPI0037A84059
MRFRALVEPPEPMRGLEVPEDVVTALGAGRRPRVAVTVGGHTWTTRVAVMRGRNLLGFSRANREAAGAATGDEVEVSVALAADPPPVTEPPDLARALDADPAARAAYDRLSPSARRRHVLAVEGAKKPETRERRVAQVLAALRDG